MRERSWFAKGTMLDTPDSKSKSKPSMTALPKGRLAFEPDLTGPKIDQRLLAALTAEVESVKPPSV